LLSYVDDLWSGCRPDDDVEALYGELTRFIRALGMRPKLGAERAITDIRRQAVTWLGYRLRLIGNQLTIRSAFFAPTTRQRRHQKHQLLVAKFARLHDRPLGLRRPNDLVRGIVGYLAPTLPYEDPQRIYTMIAQAAVDAGFREIWSLEEVLEHWQDVHECWLKKLATPQGA
jgi:hypothetical protein